ncbi:tyrosine-type recombinase/integrase [Vogesella indigofera]|uniref:tyrosine-type recombinase/integrase n=1 Tax=Vogesella indigofera TaxID=45465 RepID=UPI00234E5A0B|nr:integrase arm-type DNA-binding domain-containing protein [Vogesella indigofera]MDC7700591.1 tyrosine-type recombinase/integrase [Vogesella indigofera]
MPITKLQIDKAKPRDDGKPLKLYDGQGLYLWVLKTGSKVWRFKYTWDGKEKMLALGRYPDLTLKDAREKRDSTRRLLAKDTDPSAKRRNDRMARLKAERGSFEMVAREWHRVSAAEWTERHAASVLKSLDSYLFPSLGRRPVSEITPFELLEVLRKVEATGKLDTAKRLRERCNSIFRLGIISGLCTFNPAADLTKALKAPVSKPRPALSNDALPGFLAMLHDAPQMLLQTRLLFQVLMTCFTRVGETVRAEWTHIDFENGIWTIPPENRKLKSKLKAMANPHLVPLPRQIVAVFLQLRQHARPNNPYVFPSFRRPRQHMNEATPLKALERMGYGGANKEHGHIVTHGFRATASTILNESGFNPDAVERQLAHIDKNTVRAAYNRAQYMQERRDMMQHWADYLDSRLEAAMQHGTMMPPEHNSN